MGAELAFLALSWVEAEAALVVAAVEVVVVAVVELGLV